MYTIIFYVSVIEFRVFKLVLYSHFLEKSQIAIFTQKKAMHRA